MNESRMMNVAGGFEQCYNARAANDKEQVIPMNREAPANPEGLKPCLLVDTDYFSEKNVVACVNAGITPLIAVKREEHHPNWRERLRSLSPWRSWRTTLSK